MWPRRDADGGSSPAVKSEPTGHLYVQMHPDPTVKPIEATAVPEAVRRVGRGLDALFFALRRAKPEELRITLETLERIKPQLTTDGQRQFLAGLQQLIREDLGDAVTAVTEAAE